ncbi:MAG TPA: hypothetical protein VFU79_03940 [Nitrososphaeraceae archaeon]|jgi:hypothetical protein|nr:hypothetical protein [Nitrososphaeraceae archaeon]
MKPTFFFSFLLAVLILAFSIACLTTFDKVFGLNEKSNNNNKDTSLTCSEIGPHLLVQVVTEKGTEKVIADFKRFVKDQVIVSQPSSRDQNECLEDTIELKGGERIRLIFMECSNNNNCEIKEDAFNDVVILSNLTEDEINYDNIKTSSFGETRTFEPEGNLKFKIPHNIHRNFNSLIITSQFGTDEQQRDFVVTDNIILR